MGQAWQIGNKDFGYSSSCSILMEALRKTSDRSRSEQKSLEKARKSANKQNAHNTCQHVLTGFSMCQAAVPYCLYLISPAKKMSFNKDFLLHIYVKL